MRKAHIILARAVSMAAIASVAGLLTISAAAAGDDIVDQRPIGHDHSSHAALDDTDAVAALQGINIALTEVGDGGSYVWHRTDGQMYGVAQPTASFKGANGQPCRHLVVMLNVPGRNAKIEGIACRAAAGQWQLDG